MLLSWARFEARRPHLAGEADDVVVIALDALNQEAAHALDREASSSVGELRKPRRMRL